MASPTLNSSALNDGNTISAWWGISSVDGTSLVTIAINSATGKPKMEIGTSDSAVIAQNYSTLPRDGNSNFCIGGVSTTDHSVILPISVNPTTGAILAKIN